MIAAAAGGLVLGDGVLSKARAGGEAPSGRNDSGEVPNSSMGGETSVRVASDVDVVLVEADP